MMNSKYRKDVKILRNDVATLGSHISDLWGKAVPDLKKAVGSVADDYKERFNEKTEDYLQDLKYSVDTTYQRAKYLSDKLSRTANNTPWKTVLVVLGLGIVAAKLLDSRDKN